MHVQIKCVKYKLVLDSKLCSNMLDSTPSCLQGGCIFVATLLHYFLLASFCWMLCEGIMLFLLLVVVFSTTAKKWWAFLILGWGKMFDMVIEI